MWCLLPFGLLLGGCVQEQEPPSRDHIPVLRSRLFELQEAIRSGNGRSVDSLLSVEILDEGLSRDSLLAFFNSPGDTVPFARLGNYQIFFDNNRARIECEIIDSGMTSGRPIILTWTLVDSVWLLKRFSPLTPADSAQ